MAMPLSEAVGTSAVRLRHPGQDVVRSSPYMPPFIIHCPH